MTVQASYHKLAEEHKASQAEVDELKVRLAEQIVLAKRYKELYTSAVESNSVLDSTIRAMGKQEPTAWAGDSPTKGNGRRLFWTHSEAYSYASKVEPLFPAVGALARIKKGEADEHGDN